MPCTAKKFECQRPEMGVSGVRDVKSSIVLETVKRSPVIPLEELAPE